MKPTQLSPFLMLLTFFLLLPPLMGSFLFKGRSNPTKTSHKSAPSPSLESSYSFTSTENTTQVPEHTEIALKDSASEKPGQCPRDFLPCKELCHGDDSCPHGQKCCSTGCGHTCQGNIEKGRSGHCPFILQSLCIISCKTDENCPRRKKCCRSGCGQLCVVPLLTENFTQIPEEEPSLKNFTEIPISEVPPVPETQAN